MAHFFGSHNVPIVNFLVVGLWAVASAGALTAGPAQEYTAAAAEQQLRALGGLPVPATALRVTDVMELDGAQVATVDFAGRAAHVRFRRTQQGWSPTEMANRNDWIPLAKGFSLLTQLDESGVVAFLRSIASGQLTYAAVCADSFYAPTLAALAKPESGQSSGFIMKEMVTASGEAATDRYHYRVEMSALASPKSPGSCNGVPAGKSAQTWSAAAHRLPGFAGKSYRIDAEGQISEIKR